MGAGHSFYPTVCPGIPTPPVQLSRWGRKHESKGRTYSMDACRLKKRLLRRGDHPPGSAKVLRFLSD